MSTRCITPFFRKDNPGVPIACGRCPGCLARKVSGWSFRLSQEMKVSTRADFLTLTYDTAHVPITDHGLMTLKKRDFQLFMKRLRKEHERLCNLSDEEPTPLRYYAVGEYGSKTNRPHYHVILFNCRLEAIQPSWQMGQVHYGQLTEASTRYTLKYISKTRSKIPLHSRDDRQPEFSLMSKRLGSNYLTPSMIAWHEADLLNRMYCPGLDGQKFPMPRYYKDKLYTEADRQMIGAHVAMVQEMKSGEKLDSVAQFAADQAAFNRMYADDQRRNLV